MTLACKRCNCDLTGQSSANGKCIPCFNTAQAEWSAKMAIRQDPAQFDMKRLLGCLLTQHWMHECRIIPAYMPPFPGPDTRPTCVVEFTDDEGNASYLRYSKGPLQGYFWDCYGDDMHSPELAVVSLARAPAPVRVGLVVPTHGR